MMKRETKEIMMQVLWTQKTTKRQATIWLSNDRYHYRIYQLWCGRILGVWIPDAQGPMITGGHCATLAEAKQQALHYMYQ